MAVSAFPSDTRHHRRDVAEINITPLVDVLLVLLVIFMVTAPVASGRLDLRLPQASPPQPAEPPPRVELRVQADGVYLLEGRMLMGERTAWRAAGDRTQGADQRPADLCRRRGRLPGLRPRTRARAAQRAGQHRDAMKASC